ncbi:MAG TPA: NYN domain-containing protein, partial [Gemmatimonadaceae bacterium]
MHRGPQAMASVTPYGSPPYVHAPNAALLIDFDNVTMGIRSDLGNELRSLLGSDIIKGKVAVQRAYADWRRYPQYIVPLAESSIDMIMAPAYGSSKKNATDIRLAVDAVELVFTRPEIGTYILLSGDSDFASLVTKLKEYGKYVIGVGIRESSSDLLVMNCDEYYSYNALAGLVKSGEDESVARDPWELVVEGVARMKRNGDVMRSDRLKQVMQEIDASFDEKHLGMAKFSRFCQEAAQRGLIKVARMENGQMEVDVADQPVGGHEAKPRSAPAALPAPEAEHETGTEESARRSRRGRGRDRRGGRGAPVAPSATGSAVQAPEGAAREDAKQLAPQLELSVRTPVKAPAPPVGGLPAEMSGERLTRDEALGLLRQAVLALTTSEDVAVPAHEVRRKAHELLGRDSESLSERFFQRILRDAHEADVIDLRKRGD